MKKLSIVILLTGLMVNAASAQLLKVDQVVYGMDCAPCAYGMERSFTKMNGIDQVEVSLNKGTAYLYLSPNNQVTLQEIQKKVKNGGFTAKAAEIVMQGELIKEKDEWKIRVHEEIFKVTQDTDSEILASLKPGKVKLKGHVPDEKDENPDKQWTIQIKKVL